MQLTTHQQALLDGAFGKGKSMAMQIQLAIGEGFGATEFVPITRAHVALSAQEADLWFAKKMLDAGALCAIPPTVNPGYCLAYFEEQGIVTDQQILGLMRSTDAVYRQLGAIMTYSCTPCFFGNIPRYGEVVSFSETSVTVYANAVLGARTHRESAASALCAAITGYVPKYGMLLDENRLGTVLVHVEAEMKNDFDYALLGLASAAVCEGVPVFHGLSSAISTHALMALGTQLNVSGVCDLYHIVGVTPEAQSLEQAFGGIKPKHEIHISRDMLNDALERYSFPVPASIDFVILGCPHYTYEQVKKVHTLLQGKTPKAHIWICTSAAVLELATSMGLAQELKKLGVRIVADTCVDQKMCFEHLAGSGGLTDSPKCAYYMSTFGVKPAVRDVETCIVWAIHGRAIS